MKQFKKILELKFPTDYSEEFLERTISKKLKISIGSFSYFIERKSLDARKKNSIVWVIRVVAFSLDYFDDDKNKSLEKESNTLIEKYNKANLDKTIVIVGSGPAGIFSGLYLISCGYKVIILERGKEVDQRLKDILSFEKTQNLNENSNYIFGEGGAGTFSDGKLTSRSKHISKEKRYILENYVKAGAPEEIMYLTHPHIGSDKLRVISRNMRKMFQDKGGEIIFDTKVTDIIFDTTKEGKKVKSIIAEDGKEYKCDYAIFSIGHSAYETHKMLIKNEVPFSVKQFAIGTRVEHPQELINFAQWKQKELKGVKAAEYRLTHKPIQKETLPVYSFCMCPGGKIVPAMAYKNQNIVNGMSNYTRNSKFANSAIVTAVNLHNLLKKETINPLEALEWLHNLENKFYQYSNNSYNAPANRIRDFIQGKVTSEALGNSNDITSYPFSLQTANFEELLPAKIVDSLKLGMLEFSRKIKGFEDGIMLGLESKTSAIIQVKRDKDTMITEKFTNLYIIGEGSGFSGGIISSAADGLKAAQRIVG